ncbi:MAG TPA: hypothetical protein VFJ19_05425 [Nocardioidaceae bacterium]|nr:hypothetical protein [Nocardioidaceae bacterium]
MRKFLGWVAVVLALIYLVSQPQGAADAVRGAAGGLGSAVDNVVEFVTAL